MADLPPEDEPDNVWIGPIGPIPVFHDDDPRLDEDRARWSAARRKAQALHSTDELLAGLRDDDWRVRHEIVDRLLARASTDARTLPALIETLLRDPSAKVRDAVAITLHRFDKARVLPALRRAARDGDSDVRWSARFSLTQLGEDVADK